MKEKVSIFWFRRDLRLDDNAGLYHALRRSKVPVLPIFIFDPNILNDLSDRSDPRVTFIYDALKAIDRILEHYKSGIRSFYANPLEVWQKLAAEFDISGAYLNRDYEPYAKQRDGAVEKFLSTIGVPFFSYKDQVVFESDEIRKGDGDPYTVFTPYKKRWLAKLDERLMKGISFYLTSYPTLTYAANLYTGEKVEPPTFESMEFERSSQIIPTKEVKIDIIKNYEANRDYPARAGTTRLGIHFRFGTISVREKARKAKKISDVFLNEIIWRDFYSQILDCFPHVVGKPFRAKYENIPWRNEEEEFATWCRGETGYPLVDAGMRELNATGFMHNRVRMVAASFLTKHLLIDWRKGEAYFAEKLLDFDLASNNGGWQWAAGCGTDAAPYFRIFNPASQRKKFDPLDVYVLKWIPELYSDSYPKPMVDHAFARNRCLQTFKDALRN